MNKALLMLLGALLLSGCASIEPLVKLSSFTAADLKAAAAEGKAAREAGILPAGDRWPECFEELARRVEVVSAIEEPKGVAMVAMRAHIAKARTATPVDANCAQVIIDLERDGLRIIRSLVPGGAILPLR